MGLFKQVNKRENGQILIPTLIVLVLSSLIVVPLLQFMGTGLNAIRIYREKTNQVYAADAGIQDGIWKITSGVIPKNVDFSQTYPAINVNGKSVVVKIDYVWILSGIIDPVFGPHNDWLDVNTTGNPDATGLYTISLVYDDVSGNPGNKKIHEMGVWLPFGYSYVPGSAGEFSGNIAKQEPSIINIHGGTSIKWTNVNYSFKKSGDVATQLFRFMPIGKMPKGDIAWVSSLSNDIGLSWDKMIWNYTITSTATNSSTGKNTSIIAHVSSDTGATSNIAIITYIIDPPGT